MRRFIITQDQKSDFFEYFRGNDLPIPEYYREPTWKEKLYVKTGPKSYSLTIVKNHYCEVDMADEDFLILKLKFGLTEVMDKNQTQADTQDSVCS